MGQLDPRIALGATVTPIRSPIQTLGQMAQLRSYQEEQKQREIMNQQENERRDLMLRDRRSAEDDQNVFQGFVQQHGNVDDALDEMDRRGRSEFAVGLRGKVNAERLKALDVETKRGANQLQALKMGGQIWSGVSDPGSFSTALPATRALFKNAGLDPALLDHMGSQWDEKATPKLIEDAMEWGGQQADVLAARKAAYDAANQGISVAKDARERDAYFTTSLASYLPTVTTPEEWTGALDNAAMLGAPPQTRAKFGEEFSPQAIARARTLGLTPKENLDIPGDAKRLALEARRVALEGQRVGLEGRRVTLAEQDAKDAAAGGGRSLTPNRQSEIAEWKKKQYAALEDDFRDETTKLVSITEDERPEVANRKLAIENSARDMQGLAPLEETEYELAKAGSAKELRKIRNTYKMLTGQLTPLERMQKLTDAARREQDPDKLAGLKKQIEALYKQYRNLSDEEFQQMVEERRRKGLQ